MSNNLEQYSHKQPALPAPPPPKKNRTFRKKVVILLLAAALGSAYHKASLWLKSPHNNGSIYNNLTSHGSIFEVFEKYRPQNNKNGDNETKAQDPRISMKEKGKNEKQRQEYKAIMQAAISGNISLLPKTGGKFATVNQFSIEGRSPLGIAASLGEADIVKELIKHGADVNIANNSEQTPLHFAAWNNQPSMISLLIMNMAKINAADKTGNTPLMFATARGNKEAVVALINNSANKNLINNEGQTALAIARKNGATDIEKILATPTPHKKSTSNNDDENE